jgi:hypothetical protein
MVMLVPTCLPAPSEKRRQLPVDALVPEPIFTSTHAITIDAPPEQEWPWIAQKGAGRAGWNSRDAIDNGGPSSTRIVPELQSVARGDIMPAVPGAQDAFVVEVVDPPRDLVLTVPDGLGGNAVGWEHVLEPLPGDRTRLIVRGRASSQWLARASAAPSNDHPRLLIERAYAALATLPRPLLIAFARVGHRVMEARHLRGIQRRSTAASAQRSSVSGQTWRKALLVCGVASSLLYGLMIWGIRYEGYSPVSQVPSELTAIGAPTQALWARLGWIYTVLITAFGIGVWKSADRNRAVRIVGGLILAYASLGLLWPFAPMHQRDVLAAGGGTLSDTLHQVLGGVTVFLMFLAIGFGATAFGKRFSVYSIVTIVVLLVFGGLTFAEAPRLPMNLPTPWIGLWERINISVFLLWVVVLAARVWRTRTAKGQGPQTEARLVAAGGAS